MRSWIARGIVLMLATGGCLGATPLVAAEEGPARVSLDCREAPLRTVLRQLFNDAQTPFVIRGKIPDVPITLHLDKVPLDDALQVVTRQAEFGAPGLRLTHTNNQYRFVTRTAIGADGKRPADPEELPDARKPAEDRGRVSASLTSIDFRIAVDSISREAGLNCVVDPNVPTFSVTLRLAAVPGWGALQLLARSGSQRAPGLYLGQIGEVYVVAMRPPRVRGKQPSAPSPPR
jgi:hypothetical protein